MFCPECGHKIELAAAKFCHNCGFDLSKLPKNQPSELYKLIDTSIHQKGAKDSKEASPTTSDPLPLVQPKEEKKPDVLLEPKGIKKNEAVLSEQPSHTSAGDDLATPSKVSYLRETSYDNPSWWSRFKDKWGTGWIVLGYLFFSPQASKGYRALGSTGDLLQLSGAVVCIIIYFLLRRLLLRKIETYWLASFFSGLIAYGIVWLLLFMIGKSLAGVSSEEKTFFQLLDTEKAQMTPYMQRFAQRDQELSDGFIPDPKTQQEILRNISTAEQMARLYYSKDSMVHATITKLHTALTRAFSSSPTFRQSFPLSPQDFKIVIDSTESIWREHQNVMKGLLDYQKAMFRKDPKTEEFLSSYLNSYESLTAKEKTFGVLFQRLFGQDVFAKIREFENKYYK